MFRGNSTVEESDFNIENITDQWEAIKRIKHYNQIMKTMRYETIEGEMLKKFKDTEGFVERVGLSQSTIYFKIELDKLF